MVKGFRLQVAAINTLEGELQNLSDEGLRARTETFRKQLAEGTTLDDLLPPAFATVREAAKRTLGQRHFDVQLIGGMVLHQGDIAEMKTGEGKTLVATLPVYLNALTGKGVHVVTVNDYLAKRDADWMGQIYRFLGLTVGCIIHDMSDEDRKVAYAGDVTYATNNELGFDYLRDNMKMNYSEMVQRGHAYAIVDEVDSILIDEARTPLIISGRLEDRADLYQPINEMMEVVTPEDFELDEKQRQVSFTDAGNEKMERTLEAAGLLKGTLYDIDNVTIVHHLTQALKAHKLFQRDKDYIVKRGQVVIIDEFTGRMVPGRRYSEGLHQALEAKEHVEVQPENQTLASITFQNYFRLYKKLAGMTGTAMTEASEFLDIYGLEVIEIPTNLPVSRIDEDDEIYRTQREKLAAIVQSIAEAMRRGQPILVGTTSIGRSEQLSELLKQKKYIEDLAHQLEEQAATIKSGREKNLCKHLTDMAALLMKLVNDAKKGGAYPIPHQVLNARYHEQEANIVAQAGQPGAVTIATNMAGRGTDIQLGGNAEFCLRDWIAEETKKGTLPDESTILTKRAELVADVADKKKKALEAGGLYVLATERHESRRIDNQLRGRSGRQGDPGRSKFYLSLDDDLMRIFGARRMHKVLHTLGLREGEAITHPWMNKSLETAQKKVEQHNFDIRKQILKYDDVMNDQRKVIFEQRLDIMEQKDVSETVVELRNELIDKLVTRFIPPAVAYAEQWDIKSLKEQMNAIFGLDLPIEAWSAEGDRTTEEIREHIKTAIEVKVEAKTKELGSELYRQIEKMILLQTLDHLWREHLVTLEHLRQVIGFRAYGQRDPLNEYKSEAFILFENMLGRLRENVTGQLMHVELALPQDQAMPKPVALLQMEAHHGNASMGYDEFERDLELAMADAAIAGASARRSTGPEPEKRAPLQSRRTDGAIDSSDPTTWGRVSRNAPCPCGSSKKYKHCHGKDGLASRSLLTTKYS